MYVSCCRQYHSTNTLLIKLLIKLSSLGTVGALSVKFLGSPAQSVKFGASLFLQSHRTAGSVRELLCVCLSCEFNYTLNVGLIWKNKQTNKLPHNALLQVFATHYGCRHVQNNETTTPAFTTSEGVKVQSLSTNLFHRDKTRRADISDTLTWIFMKYSLCT